VTSLSKVMFAVLNAWLFSVVLLLPYAVSAAQDRGFKNIDNVRLQELMGQGLSIPSFSDDREYCGKGRLFEKHFAEALHQRS